jgi:hypothetical protein
MSSCKVDIGRHLCDALNMTRKIKTALYLTVEQNKKLRAISKRTGIPASVLIRRGIDMILRKVSK